MPNFDAHASIIKHSVIKFLETAILAKILASKFWIKWIFAISDLKGK